MAKNKTLLEVIAEHLNLPYLSDLHSLRRADAHQAISVYYILSKIQPDDFSVEEWNEASAYIAGLDPQGSATEARTLILEYFNKKLK